MGHRGMRPDFVDVGEAGAAVDDAMRHQRCFAQEFSSPYRSSSASMLCTMDQSLSAPAARGRQAGLLSGLTWIKAADSTSAHAPPIEGSPFDAFFMKPYSLEDIVMWIRCRSAASPGQMEGMLP
jgi:hypothetical protein